MQANLASELGRPQPSASPELFATVGQDKDSTANMLRQIVPDVRELSQVVGYVTWACATSVQP